MLPRWMEENCFGNANRLGTLPFYVVLFDCVFGFFPSFLMVLQESVEFFSDVFFAFAAEHFAAFASAFSFGKFLVVFFEEEEVVLEYAAYCWVGACFALLRSGAFAACEGIPYLLFYHVWLVMVNMLVSGIDALIFPPAPRPGRKRQWICAGL